MVFYFSKNGEEELRMNKQLVLQTDFGRCDGAVSAMYGVAVSVDLQLSIHDLTHEITPFHIWEGSYRLYQTVSYWPTGTVFVSVVDPGVGSDRLSVVIKTKSGHYIVTPNNGTLTHIQKHIGIEEVREIDESINRLPNSNGSDTFHGRDVYVYTGARLSAGIISYEEVGRKLDISDIIHLHSQAAKRENTKVVGAIDILDVRFGNIWTNINKQLFNELSINYGDKVEVLITNHRRKIYQHVMTYGKSFAAIHLGEPLLYVNSLDNLGIAINQGSFAKAYEIEAGAHWEVQVTKLADSNTTAS